MALNGEWTSWQPDDGRVLLAPEREYEGAGRPLEPSRPGIALGPRRELRDPAIHAEDGRVFLLYSVAGEQGIALAELLVT